MKKEMGKKEVLKSSYKMGQALKGGPNFTWGHDPSRYRVHQLHTTFL